MEIENFISKSNFNFYIPILCDSFEYSFREEGKKWSTLWFKCNYKGKTYRFKEFFMDWFYQGFPKSMMSNFVESYSAIKSKKQNGIVYFIGKDYKGINSLASFYKGTQIEIESLENSEIDEEVITNMAEIENKAIIGKSFHERSFHARTGIWEWFEEKRIAIARWELLSFRDSITEIVSHGIIDDVSHIFVFTDKYYSKVYWLDISNITGNEENLFYRLRKKIGMYNVIFQKDNFIIGLRSPYGPIMVQNFCEKNKITFTSSSFIDFESTMNDFKKYLKFASEFTDKNLLQFKI